jgi:hypothetical protein
MGGGVCSLDVENHCDAHVCPAPLVCVSDQCRTSCTSSADCIAHQCPAGTCDEPTSGTNVDAAAPDASGADAFALPLDMGSDAISPIDMGADGGPCPACVLNATGVTCTASGCDYTSCTSGFVDCDGQRANGCETTEGASACTASCTNCVVTQAHASGIGCNNLMGVCSFSGCMAGYADCDAAPGCETAEDPSHCGLTCTDCATGQSNATASCTAGTCGIASCVSGWASCDGVASNGCEVMTPGTDVDCCGVQCTGGTHCTSTADAGFACG